MFERVRVVPALATLELQRESEPCSQVFRIGGRELLVSHQGTITGAKGTKQELSSAHRSA